MLILGLSGPFLLQAKNGLDVVAVPEAFASAVQVDEVGPVRVSDVFDVTGSCPSL